ncbi:MAG: hypothetical protein ACOC3I_07700 [Verrucomicrobiota bacterium]
MLERTKVAREDKGSAVPVGSQEGRIPESAALCDGSETGRGFTTLRDFASKSAQLGRLGFGPGGER